mgnify:CR=1 FL=1
MKNNLTKSKLISLFQEGCKKKNLWKIGTEHEKFGFKKKNLKPITYDDINKIFLRLSSKYFWEENKENGKITSLSRDNCSITLEPGGQIELSGAPLNDLFETCKEVNNHQNELTDVCQDLAIDFMGMGFIPKWKLENIPIMPKARYRIMKEFMANVGTHGKDMMFRTSTIQANFDYSSETDMIRKFRVSQSLQPIIIALYANSPFQEGKLTQFLSYRSFVWTKTDKSRCGILDFVYDDNFSFERYVDYLLQVPMYFLVRENKYIDAERKTFSDFLDNKIVSLKNQRPTIDDWAVHLSTVFPEVRLKTYIELRGADGGPWSRVCALPAFWTGILYDEEILDDCSRLIKKWGIDDIKNFYDSVRKNGLKAIDPDGNPMLNIARNILKWSRRGLRKRNILMDGITEEHFLDPLFKILKSESSPAETWKRLFINEWNENVDKIYKSNYFNILNKK